jgi:plasmid stability protein
VAAVHVRDLPREVIEALKRRASRNNRSLQQELKRILSAIAEEEAPKAPLPPIQLKMSRAPAGPAFSRAEIYRDDGR